MDNDPTYALKDIQKVLVSQPEDFHAICTHAKIIYHLGQFERSLMLWHKAKKIKKSSQEVGRHHNVHKAFRFMGRLRPFASRSKQASVTVLLLQTREAS